jgi:hypothetical protein
MSEFMATYLQDHLTGAKFAINLLQDLTKQRAVPAAAEIANRLLPEIEADKVILERMIKAIGGDPSLIKEATAWITQNAFRAKVNMMEPFGIFEAIEMLCLGVMGKLALWSALESSSQSDIPWVDLKYLQDRARAQHAVWEEARLSLAAIVLNWKPVDKVQPAQ